MRFISLLLPSSTLLLGGCNLDLSSSEGAQAPVSREDARKYGDGKIFGDDLLIFGGKKRYDPKYGGGMANANQYLWKAALEVTSFLPLASSDSAGGVIVTDWYTPGDRPNERLKLIVNISDRVLRADALSVTIHKQIRAKNGEWVGGPADEALAREMEDLILTKARELKVKGS